MVQKRRGEKTVFIRLSVDRPIGDEDAKVEAFLFWLLRCGLLARAGVWCFSFVAICKKEGQLSERRRMLGHWTGTLCCLE